MTTSFRQIISDDFTLLDEMMADCRHLKECFRPTPYWAGYVDSMVDMLRCGALNDFRANKIGAMIGGLESDPPLIQYDLNRSRLLSNKYSRKIPYFQEFLGWASNILNKAVARMPVTVAHGITVDDILMLAYNFAEAVGRRNGAAPLDKVADSALGHPMRMFQVEGRPYTMGFLRYYMRYTYAARYIDFSTARITVELGAGSGMQTAMIKRLHPEMIFVIFDMPPSLYVGERYLDSLFPGDVVGYRQCKDIPGLSSLQPGKIYFFPNWRISMLDTAQYDIFWNARSMTEMEPEIVSMYLSHVTRGAKHIYLNQIRDGVRTGSKRGEAFGRRKVLWSNYDEWFAADYEQVACAPAMTPTSPRVQTIAKDAHSFEISRDSFVLEGVWRRRSQ